MQAVSHRKSYLDSIVESVFDSSAANFWLQKVNPLWSVNQSLGKIVQKVQNGTDTVSLTLQTNKHFIPALAGQHHPVIVECDGRRYERTYSLTQIDNNHVLLTVKKVSGGVVSSWLVDQAKIGQLIEFGQPYGEMTLAEQGQRTLLLAAGSGITPMYSLLEDQIKQNKLKPTHLMYWVKQPEDIAFKGQFEQWAQQQPNFSYQFLYTQHTPADARLNESHLLDLEDLEQTTVYVCGPSGFVATAENLFQHVSELKCEAFSLTPVISNDIGFVNITLTQSNKTLVIPKGQSILSALEQQNIQPQHGCRMGICNKCACQKAQGSTKNLVNGAENNEPGNLLKICVNSAQTDLTIDL